MSSSVCQGLQSCLEPRLVEPRVLRLKLAPPNSNFSRSSGWAKRPCVSNCDPEDPKEKPHNEENNTTIVTNTTNNNKNNKNTFDDCQSNIHNNGDLGGWSFIQALTNQSQSSKEVVEDDQKVYIHPLVKRSSSMLSEKSLEMCTESLGCETGSGISESSDDIPSHPSESPAFLARERLKMREIYSAKKLNPSRSFPPPLTSISGSGCVQVRPHREGGRLVIKAVTVAPSNTFFHAERGDGRLRLHLLKNNSPNFDDMAAEEKEKTGEEDVEEEEVEAEEEEELDYEDDDSVCWGEEMDGNSENVGGEIGIENIPRPSRCKEGGQGLWNLEAYNWVATS